MTKEERSHLLAAAAHCIDAAAHLLLVPGHDAVSVE